MQITCHYHMAVKTCISIFKLTCQSYIKEKNTKLINDEWYIKLRKNIANSI